MDIVLLDDGTLDTVLSVNGEQVRFDPEFAIGWRCKKTGVLDLARFIADNYTELREVAA